MHFYRIHNVNLRNLRLEEINRALESEVEIRKKTESVARKSLAEKEVLLKEIHHRVKNNLQVISSLLSLQSSKIQDMHLLDMFNDSKSRIRSMALIHEKLYQSDDFAHINFKAYTESLIRELKVSFNQINRKIHFEINIQNVDLPIDLAVPCGLVVNELVTNAYKYAFPDEFSGDAVITVSMKLVDDKVQLVVKDNGIGIPDSVDPENAKSLGLTLVKLLAKEQMNGDLAWQLKNGTSCTIDFSVDET